MTNDEIRIAIAEACGWVWYRLPNPSGRDREYRMLAHPSIHEYDGQSPYWLVRADGTERVCNMEYMEINGYMPDYLKDRNAIVEAIKQAILGNVNLEKAFLEHLNVLLDARADDETGPVICEYEMAAITAGPNEFCEAFLLALGKWKPVYG